jgi:hypothetical protein
MWRKLIARAAESWYIYLVGCRSSHEANTQSALGMSGPPTTMAGLFFSLRATESPREGCATRASPRAGDDHFSALLSPQAAAGLYVGEE